VAPLDASATHHAPLPAAVIGPNALLQLDPLLQEAGLAAPVYAAAGVAGMPDGTEMIDERPVASVHRALRQLAPEAAPALSWEAGVGTGRYILTHRIPRPAQTLLLTLPWRLSARLLAKAIAANSWTFAGSGKFTVKSPYCFELGDNPLVAGETSPTPICHWHCGVFTTLYAALVHPEMRCTETACCAKGDPVCRFELTRERRSLTRLP
jgi:divinyl protochlorophyllide a 8-vinyl-reductase